MAHKHIWRPYESKDNFHIARCTTCGTYLVRKTFDTNTPKQVRFGYISDSIEESILRKYLSRQFFNLRTNN